MEIEEAVVETGEKEKVAKGIEGTEEGVDGTGPLEDIEAARSSKLDSDSVDSLSRESVANMAITASILTAYRARANSPTEDWQKHRSNNATGRTQLVSSSPHIDKSQRQEGTTIMTTGISQRS